MPFYQHRRSVWKQPLLQFQPVLGFCRRVQSYWLRDSFVFRLCWMQGAVVLAPLHFSVQLTRVIAALWCSRTVSWAVLFLPCPCCLRWPTSIIIDQFPGEQLPIGQLGKVLGGSMAPPLGFIIVYRAPSCFRVCVLLSHSAQGSHCSKQ